jgi:uncharacterized protein YsxB (DUF464 family)
MIRVWIKGDPKKIRGFLVWGHAGFAPRGTDIVCAGVSAIATAALMGLVKRLPEGVRVGISPQGLMLCKLKEHLSEDEAGEAQVILDTMAIGLDAIRRSHKQCLQITYRR